MGVSGWAVSRAGACRVAGMETLRDLSCLFVSVHREAEYNATRP